MKSTSNHSEQRLFREEVLFMQKNAGVFHVIDGEYRQVHYFKWRLE